MFFNGVNRFRRECIGRRIVFLAAGTCFAVRWTRRIRRAKGHAARSASASLWAVCFCVSVRSLNPRNREMA